jgi:hypothetical protein
LERILKESGADRPDEDSRHQAAEEYAEDRFHAISRIRNRVRWKDSGDSIVNSRSATVINHEQKQPKRLA